MAKKFDLNKAVSDYCLEATQKGRYVQLAELVESVAEASDRLEENVRKSVLPLLMASTVRVDEDVFADPKYFEFDVRLVDDCIERVLNGRDYLPICSFEPFDNFPLCGGGRSWNVFIFESYCLNYSARFKRLSLLFNKQCTGVIVRKEETRSFHEIAADMLANDTTAELTESSAVDYLKSRKMIGKAKYANVGKLLDDAAKIREKLLSSSSRPSESSTKKANVAASRAKTKPSKRLAVDKKKPEKGR